MSAKEIRDYLIFPNNQKNIRDDMYQSTYKGYTLVYKNTFMTSEVSLIKNGKSIYSTIIKIIEDPTNFHANILKAIKESLTDNQNLTDNTIIKTKNEKTFFEASTEGNIEQVKELIEMGVNLNVRSYCGYTPLIIASMNNHKNIVELLLDAGADPNIQSNDGKTALGFALYYKNEKIVELLQKK